jgi:macrolide transport system ATP-binding/permease protein
MRRFFARLANLFRPRRAENELSREIESHLALLREDFERRGLPPKDAALAARRAYGGVEFAKELHRDARSFVWIEQLLQDIRYAARNLVSNPGFTLVAALALALGLGANATIFSVYNAIALKPLPVADASRVVRVRRWSRSFGRDNFAYPEYEYLRDHTSMLSGLTASSSPIPVMASVAGSAAEHFSGHAVSANYFVELGVKPRVGRTFLPDEDRAAGANALVVLSFHFWQQKFRGDTNAIGQQIKLNGVPYTIIGVAPREFTGTGGSSLEGSFWAPLSMIEQLDPAFGAGWREQWRDANHPGFELLARLKDGVGRAQGQAETNVLLLGYLSSRRESQPTTAVTLHRASYFSFADDLDFQLFSAAVLLIVSLVLLVACANVANMLLARGVARRREIAVRLALGAGRSRVVRQLLTESILLSLMGGAAGIVLSAWTGRLLWLALRSIVLRIENFGGNVDVYPDSHVLLYGLALSIFTGVLFGLVPALQSTRADLNTAIKQEGASLEWRLGRSRLRGLLLGAQVTVSVLLLVVGGGLMGSLVSALLQSADLGFESHGTYRLQVAASSNPEILWRIRERMERLPELRGVTIGSAPLREVFASFPMTAGQGTEHTALSFATDGYFETLGIRLLQGRSFTRTEAARAVPVAVISESTARRLWPGRQDVLGKYVTLDSPFVNLKDFEVIGIVKDVRFVSIAQFDPLHVYLSAGVISQRLFGGLLFRIRSDRDRARTAIESAVASVDPNLVPSVDMASLEEGPVALQRGFLRVVASLAGILTLLSLTLAGVGVYGVMAFLVNQRTREIGIRVTLGATPAVVTRSIILQGLKPVFIGMLVGLGAAARVVLLARTSGIARDLNLFSRLFSSPALYEELALVLMIAVLASAVPARRALRVDPVVALRHE